MHKAFAGAASAIVLLTVVWGLAVTGSPATARLQQFDARRLEDLQSIRREIENICLGGGRQLPASERQLERPLPGTLGQVADAARHRRPDIVDPETGQPYRYEILDTSRFRLCATFHLERDEEADPMWNHPAGSHCFEFDVLKP